MELLLASASPRRLALLAQIGIRARAVPSNIDEIQHPDETPEAACLRFAREKAAAVAKDYPDRVVLAADTIGIFNGRLLGKPHSPDDAYAMLKMLAGRTHTVLTAYCIRQQSNERCACASASVAMRPFDEALIRRYLATGEPMDKAGAYGIQGKGALLVERINGDFYAVVGLPLAPVAQILQGFGITAPA